MSGTDPGASGPNPYDPRPYAAYPYGQVPYGPAPDHPEATKVLILGILGLALCQVVSPFAWVIGGRVRKEIAAAGGQVGGHQMVQIGWILGIVGSVMLACALLFVLLYVGFFVLVAFGSLAQ